MQALSQKVCQKYGWSARFEKEEDADGGGGHHWCCYVTVGLNDERKFSAPTSSTTSSAEATADATKEGMASAAQAAVDGLQDELARQEAKPKLELTQVFPMHNPHHQHHNDNNVSQPTPPPPFIIRGSSPPNWEKYIWSHKPKIVGIDTEGNQSHPPVLVQIATDDCVLLEITSMLGHRLSENLRRLLAHKDIVKVLCDKFGHHDKRSLGLLPPLEKKTKNDKKPKSTSSPSTSNNINNGVDELDFSQGSIVDLEALSAKVLGPVKVARGLSRIVTLSMPELNVIVGKPQPSKGGRFKSIGRFTLIEQGKAPPLSSLRDLSRKDQHYAAVDAWATLQAYKRLSVAVAHSDVV